MRDITEVQIDELVVHILERKRKVVVDGEEQELKRFVLSDRSLTLDPDSELAKFFGDHIVESLQDIGAKAALFKDDRSESPTETEAEEAPDPGEPADPDEPEFSPMAVCQDVLLGKMDFVFGSRDLAKRLWKVMLGNDSISDGDLAICRFTAVRRRDALDEGDDQPGEDGESYLAIIKMDPVGAFRNVVEGEDTEQTTVTLVSDPYVFPRRTDVLQKGAYVQPIDEDGEFHLLLVDKQTHRGIAQFFTHDFLGAGHVADAAEMTRRLFDCLIRSLNDIRSGSITKDEVRVTLTSDQDLYLGEEIYRLFEDDFPQNDPNTGRIIPAHQVFDEDGCLDLEKWIGKLNLPVDPDVDDTTDRTNRRLLTQTLLGNVADCMGGTTRIERDLALVRHMTRRRSFSLQKGGTYSVLEEEFGRMIQSVQRVGNKFRVTFETTSWWENLR